MVKASQKWQVRDRGITMLSTLFAFILILGTGKICQLIGQKTNLSAQNVMLIITITVITVAFLLVA